MLKYMRNKMVSVTRRGRDALAVHGVLDDDLYGLELDVTISIDELEILSVEGKWNRWTTPECRRSTQFLQDAVGFRLGGDFSQKVNKIVGRRACRHYANLLLECCHTAKEAAWLARWEEAKADRPELTFEDFITGNRSETPSPGESRAVQVEAPVQPAVGDVEEKRTLVVSTAMTGGSVIDLHVHTFPASPCSSAAVDDLIVEAKRIGLDGICLTDHNYLWTPAEVETLRQRHGFMILRGNEITTDQGDMLVFGLERNIRGIIKVEDLRAKVVEAGGYMIVAHPFRGFLVVGVGQVGFTPEKAMARRLFRSVDALEVMNGKVTEGENHFAAQVAAGLGLPTTGGSDAHEVSEVGQYATWFAQRIRNEEEFIAALKTGEYTAVEFRNQGAFSAAVKEERS